MFPLAIDRLARTEDAACGDHAGRASCACRLYWECPCHFQIDLPRSGGGDIGCGITAVGFNISSNLIEDPAIANRLLSLLQDLIPIHKHRHLKREQDAGGRGSGTTAEADSLLSDRHLETLARRDGCFQFGTLGRGNHFVEFQADEESQLWLLVHSGSRNGSGDS